MFANRVVAVTPAARAEGVDVGLRRREAQGRCPGLAVLDHDPARDARAWEPVVARFDDICPRIEVAAPGRLAFPTRGPSRYFGGDGPLAERVAARVPGGLVGIADGPFAAWLAARAPALRAAGRMPAPCAHVRSGGRPARPSFRRSDHRRSSPP